MHIVIYLHAMPVGYGSQRNNVENRNSYKNNNSSGCRKDWLSYAFAAVGIIWSVRKVQVSFNNITKLGFISNVLTKERKVKRLYVITSCRQSCYSAWWMKKWVQLLYHTAQSQAKVLVLLCVNVHKKNQKKKPVKVISAVCLLWSNSFTTTAWTICTQTPVLERHTHRTT